MKEKDIKNQKTEAPAAEETAEKKAEAQGELFPERSEVGDDKYIEALEEKLGQCIAENNNAKNMAMRLQADFDNYRKRNAALSEEMKMLGKSMVIEKMLTVLDNCDLARKYITDEAALTGFNMMERQILDALESFGLKETEALGADFDAATMSAVERVSSPGNEGKVVEVVLKGYKLGGKVLRPASVKVGC